MRRHLCKLFAALMLILTAGDCLSAAQWISLFDGKSLNGWTLMGGSGPGYIVDNGWLVCPRNGGGTLYTDGQYSDFIFRMDFRLSKAGNNGVALRAPLVDAGGYDVLESQILDHDDPIYKDILPTQTHGSLYKVAAATRGALRPHDQWNSEEIEAIGRRIKIRLNDKLILDADINRISDPAILFDHPGLLRDYGRIGFMGHGPAEVAFRNIAIKDLSKPERDNCAPKGFKALFNGRDLTGWKGLVANPIERAKMSPGDLSTAQNKANQSMREHWSVSNGILAFDGKGDSLCTTKDYRDFEMLVDWKIEPGGDSGIYLRGAPQVQIWSDPIGSGGLYNNQQPANLSKPLIAADNAPGQWNRFRILMIGNRVSVFLNNLLVVNKTVMENYWERDKPIYATGQIELQNHNSKLWFKNIYIREIKVGNQ